MLPIFRLNSVILVLVFASLGTAIILRESDVKRICRESESSPGNAHLETAGPLLRSQLSDGSKTPLERRLLKSLTDEFIEIRRASGNNYYQGFYPRSKSMVMDYKVIGKDHSSADIANYVATGDATVNGRQSIQVRQSGDLMKKSYVKKLILLVQPNLTPSRSEKEDSVAKVPPQVRVPARTETLPERFRRSDNSDKIYHDKNLPESIRSFCDQIHLEQPMDSANPVQWWITVRKIRDQMIPNSQKH